MGYFKEEITLSNILDQGFASHGYIKEAEIRTLKVEAMPDTGAWTLVINEEICQKLGLDIKETSRSSLANGQSDIYDVTEGVEIRYTVFPQW
jgi:predicted aspartyl protease